MRRRFLPLLLCIASLSTVLAAQDRPSSGEEVRVSPPRSTIRGRVVYEDNGMPIRRGLIGLLNADTLPKDTRTFVSQSITPDSYVLTGDDGSFEFANVPAGIYYPSVNVPNVVNPQSINAYFGNNSTVSRVKLDQFFKKIETDGISPTTVDLAVKRGASISGRVIYSDRMPAIGREVKLLRKGEVRDQDEFIDVKKTLTDDRGWFRFIELPPGNYFTYVSEPADHRSNAGLSDDWNMFSRSELKIYYPQTSDPSRAKGIEVDWGTSEDGVDIEIPNRKLFRISGRVIPKDPKRPKEKFNVRFESAEPDRSDASTNQVDTDLDGNFSFKDLQPGKYRLHATLCSSCTWMENPEARSEYGDGVKDVMIEDSDASGIEIEMLPAASVAVSVTVENKKPIPADTIIWLLDRKLHYERSSRWYRRESTESPQDRWDFQFKRMPTGKFELIARADNAYVKSVFLGSREVTNDQIEIKSGEVISDIKVTLSTEMGTVRGAVFQNDKTPAELVTVLLVPVEKRRRTSAHLFFNALTDRDGLFEIKAAPGDYFVTFPTRETNTLKEDAMESLLNDASKITVTAEKTLDIKLKIADP